MPQQRWAQNPVPSRSPQITPPFFWGGCKKNLSESFMFIFDQKTSLKLTASLHLEMDGLEYAGLFLLELGLPTWRFIPGLVSG